MGPSQKNLSCPRMHSDTHTRMRHSTGFDATRARRDVTHYHRFLLAPRCACTSSSGVLSEADVEGGDSCDISIRGWPKGRVPEVDPPLPRPDQSNFNNDHSDHATFRSLPAVSLSLIHSLHSISQLVSQSQGCLKGYRNHQTRTSSR